MKLTKHSLGIKNNRHALIEKAKMYPFNEFGIKTFPGLFNQCFL